MNFDFKVVLSHRVQKELERLDRSTLKRLQARIDALACDPLSSRLSMLLEMGQGERSARVRNWRIIYKVEETSRTLKILSVYPRCKAYRKF